MIFLFKATGSCFIWHGVRLEVFRLTHMIYPTDPKIKTARPKQLLTFRRAQKTWTFSKQASLQLAVFYTSQSIFRSKQESTSPKMGWFLLPVKYFDMAGPRSATNKTWEVRPWHLPSSAARSPEAHPSGHQVENMFGRSSQDFGAPWGLKHVERIMGVEDNRYH